VNKNHFAGWMLMALPLVLGRIGGAFAHAMRGRELSVRQRILWLSSPDASRILLWIAAAFLMALSLILTMSRSGMGVGALIAMASALGMLRATKTQGRRIGGLTLLAVLVVGVVAWAGPDVIAARFSAANWGQLGHRKGAWLDALDIARRYPLAGTGFNTYGVATLFYQRHDLFWHYAQAHNDYLQLAAEGGLLLVLPAAACVVVFSMAVRRRFREDPSVSVYWLRAGAVTGLLAIALQDMVDFSLQMPGNAFLFAVIFGISLHRAPGRNAMARTE
jgi:O-antigen ligase